MAKYKVEQKIIRKETNQRFTIKKVIGLLKHRYFLKGPHSSLDLDVSETELDELFILVQ